MHCRPISQAAVHEKSHYLCAAAFSPAFELHEHMQSSHSYTAAHTHRHAPNNPVTPVSKHVTLSTLSFCHSRQRVPLGVKHVNKPLTLIKTLTEQLINPLAQVPG